jgi:hypothetical protein
MTEEADCARCALLGRVCPVHESERMLDDHRAWFTEHFSSEDPWPEGELAAKCRRSTSRLLAGRTGLPTSSSS